METFLDIVKKNPNSIVEIFVSSSSIDNHTITLNNGIIVSSNGEDEWEDFLDNENIFKNLEVLIDRDIEGISINLTDSKKLKKANSHKLLPAICSMLSKQTISNESKPFNRLGFGKLDDSEK